KELETCAGLRNQAAHGDFGPLSHERAGLMEQQTSILLRRLEELPPLASRLTILVRRETARVLREAEAEETRLRTEFEARARNSLAIVARDLPSRVDNAAKDAAQREPDVARELGAARIKDLRRELTAVAEVLASEVETAFDQIEWPRPMSRTFSEVTPRDIHAALLKFFNGPRADKVTAILQHHGFSRRRVLPEDFYDEKDFGAVAEALTSLSIAEHALAAAKAADDRATVDSLWSDE
ncbi:hypothetical protein, partial [Amycolatopsis decaplanina]